MKRKHPIAKRNQAHLKRKESRKIKAKNIKQRTNNHLRDLQNKYANKERLHPTNQPNISSNDTD